MKNKLNREIFFEEYVSVNDINQYLFHAGTNYNNPVMLFLHGGPGNPETLYAHYFQEKWEEVFTVVHWEQRGSGKTLIKNPNKFPTIDLILDDLLEVVKYLKNKYNKDKVIILGHSWGSVLGSIFIKKYPEYVDYYIGVGQVVNMMENERVGYDKVMELAIKTDDKKSIKKLKNLNGYPNGKFDIERTKVVRAIQGKYNLASKFSINMLKIALKSPVFKFSDIIALFKALKANNNLLNYLFSFDLTSLDNEYKMPIYYILGENDWQTPHILAQEYFENINAPCKKLFVIPDAGHITMFDQPQEFTKVLQEINKIACN